LALDDGPSQLFEQLRMAWLGGRADVVYRMHDPAAHVLSPDAVGDGSREEWIVGPRDPVGELILTGKLRPGRHLIGLELGILEAGR